MPEKKRLDFFRNIYYIKRSGERSTINAGYNFALKILSI